MDPVRVNQGRLRSPAMVWTEEGMGEGLGVRARDGAWPGCHGVDREGHGPGATQGPGVRPGVAHGWAATVWTEEGMGEGQPKAWG